MDLSDKMKSNIVALQESAQQFTLKGDYEKAIAAWKKILTLRDDANIYNTIGDLYIKKGIQAEAVTYFTQAADRFKSDGFYQKAIAIYKKILNIVPFEVNALISLADLDAEKGLTSNAVTYYAKAAEKLSRDGNTDKAIDIYNRVLLLKPSDISIRMRIADLWQSRGLPEKAANDYAVIASAFMEKDDAENAIEFFSKALVIDPKNAPAYIGLSVLAEKKENMEQALEFASKALQFSQYDKDILTKHVQLSIRAGKIEDTKNTLAKLISATPDDLFYKKLLGSVYVSEGQFDKAWEELLPCIDEMLQDQKWDEACQLLARFKEMHPVPVGQRLITAYRGKEDQGSLAGEIMDLAVAYESEGIIKDAAALYKELSLLQPDNALAKSKIEEMEALSGSGITDAQGPLSVSGDEQQAQEYSAPVAEDITAAGTEEAHVTGSGLTEEPGPLSDNIPVSEPGSETEPASSSGEAANQNVENALSDERPNELIEDDDYEAHYTAGIEYKQKGLLDDAIREFKIVAKDPDKALLSSKMIALCYMEKGAYSHAVSELTALLDSLPGDDERRLDIKYELAGAYMKNNDHTRALEIFSDIIAAEYDYKDVLHKIDILKNLIQKPDPRQKSRKNRISYI